jgi:hypothetical protein
VFPGMDPVERDAFGRNLREVFDRMAPAAIEVAVERGLVTKEQIDDWRSVYGVEDADIGQIFIVHFGARKVSKRGKGFLWTVEGSGVSRLQGVAKKFGVEVCVKSDPVGAVSEMCGRG